MAAANVPKLYRIVIEDVLSSVREAFLDDGVDEQVLMDLRQMWEKKINETKAVDNNAREPEQMVVPNKSNRTNNSSGSSHSRNSQSNKESINAINQTQQQSQPTPQQSSQQPSQPATRLSTPQIPGPTVVPNNNHQICVNPSSGTPNLSHLHLQTGTNIVLGPNPINYTTNTESQSERQKNMSNMSSMSGGGHSKLVFVQSHPGQVGQLGQLGQLGHTGSFVMTSGQSFNINNLNSDILSQITNNFQQSSTVPNHVITQPTVLHHTSNVNLNPNTIQYASAPANTSRQPPAQATSPPTTLPAQVNRVVQLDGAHDTSDEDEDEDEYRDNDDDHDDNDDEVNDDENEGQGEDEEPLNSEDDVSDEDPTELFETDNVVVCQYDKITRSRNKWKFHLKDGIMNLQGKDYVFQKAVGDAEW